MNNKTKHCFYNSKLLKLIRRKLNPYLAKFLHLKNLRVAQIVNIGEMYVEAQVDAMLEISHNYEYGKVVRKDEVEASKWSTKAKNIASPTPTPHEKYAIKYATLQKKVAKHISDSKSRSFLKNNEPGKKLTLKKLP